METENINFFQRYKIYLILIVVGFAVYFNGLFGTFVWDDVYQIQNNILVHSVSNFLSFFLGSTFSPENSSQLGGLYYRPLMTLSFSLLYSLFGPQTFPYHLLQLCFHIANALLLFYLFKKFFKEMLAFFLALVFLVHPINVESVVYAATLAEPLFVFFGLIALILFLKEHISVKRYISILLLLVASIFSKETGILFGFIILIYYFLFKKKTIPDTIKIIGIVVIQIAFYLFMRFEVAKVTVIKLPDVPMMTAPLSERIFSMPAIFLFYIKTFFFPINLFIYQEWMIPGPSGDFFLPLILDILFLGLLGIGGMWLWKRNKKQAVLYLFFALWFLLGVGFHMQLLPLDMTVADHMFYFPMLGLLGAIGLVAQNVKIKDYNVRYTVILFAILILCFFAVRTLIRNTNWYNGISLYSNDLQYQPNDRIENLLATQLFQAGQYTQAQKYFEDVIAKNPHQPPLVYNLATIYEAEGNFQKAEELYKSSISFDDTGVLYSNYARILMLRDNKVKQAKKISGEGLLKFPQNSTLMLIDAIAIYKLGDKQAALKEVQQAKNIAHDPRYDQIYQGIQNDNLQF